ncbi:MAG: hypothetical protein L3J52_09865, partial [Proteobacteria bacterium]|nr:hypothetical protein [Pseudomonadota bacterium]
YEQFLERIGYSTRPEATLETLNRIYKSWCRKIGYDNVLKRIYFEENHDGPFPVMDPNDFLTTWMKHGTSGSCWPSGEALYSVLSLTGFKVERVAGQMLECNDPMNPNHGAMIVDFDGRILAQADPGPVEKIVIAPIDISALREERVRRLGHDTVAHSRSHIYSYLNQKKFIAEGAIPSIESLKSRIISAK